MKDFALKAGAKVSGVEYKKTEECIPEIKTGEENE